MKDWREGLTVKEIERKEERRRENARLAITIIIASASIVVSTISILLTLNVL